MSAVTPRPESSPEVKEDSKDGRVGKLVKGANDLSLGLSMVVAVLLGLGLGYGAYKLTGIYWLIWLGLGYGVAAAVLNVIKAYRRLSKELDSLKDEDKYRYMEQNKDSKSSG